MSATNTIKNNIDIPPLPPAAETALLTILTLHEKYIDDEKTTTETNTENNNVPNISAENIQQININIQNSGIVSNSSKEIVSEIANNATQETEYKKTFRDIIKSLTIKALKEIINKGVKATISSAYKALLESILPFGSEIMTWAKDAYNAIKDIFSDDEK